MQSDVDGVASTICPVVLIDCEARLGPAVCQIRRDVDLDPHFFGEARGLRVAARNEDAAIGKQLFDVFEILG